MPSTAIEIPTNELPLWMRRARRGIDWGMLIVIAFSLAISWSFVASPDLPHTNQTENYVYRAADYARALGEGHLYPRWSPYVFGGYGAPIPHYYPPGAPYTAALIQVLFTNDTVTAVRLVYILALCFAGSMLYVFVTRWVGAGAGILASMLYVYSPFVGLTVPHVLGDLPAALALALLPAVLWAVTRLMQFNGIFDLSVTVLLTSALILTDVRFVPVALFLLVGLLLWGRAHLDKGVPWGQLALVILLGAALAAFYWLPALAEQNEVVWRPPLVMPSEQLAWPEIVSPLRQIDSAALLAPPQLTLGWLLPVLSALVLLTSLLRRAWGSFHMLFLVMGAALLLFGLVITPQFAWLLGPMTLCFSAAGSAVLDIRRLLPVQHVTRLRKALRRGISASRGPRRDLRRLLVWGLRPHAWQRVWLPVLLVIVLVASLPVWLSPTPAGAFGDTDAVAQILHEQRGFGIAALPPDAPVPATIAPDLAPSRYLLNGYISGNINKIAPDQVSVDTQFSVLSHTSQSDRFQIRTRRLTTLNVLTAYFPGWEAAVDGRQVALFRNEQTQLMSVTVPVTPGGELHIWLGATPIRSVAWAISTLTLLLLVVLTGQRLRLPQNRYDDVDLLSPQEARLVGTVSICFLGALWLLSAPGSPAPLRAAPGFGLDGSYALESRTDRGLEAIAYRLPDIAFAPGDTLELTLYWRAIRPLTANYQVQVSLRDSSGSLAWNRTALRNPGDYPTQRWPRSQYVVDPYRIQLAQSIVPGEYQIAVEVFACDPECSQDKRIAFFNRDGSLAGPVLYLPGRITIMGR